jgi:hypothetical protein
MLNFSEEMASWNILNGKGVFPRGHPHFPVGPVIEEGEAIRALLAGELPATPEGTWWFYGLPTGRSTTTKGS